MEENINSLSDGSIVPRPITEEEFIGVIEHLESLFSVENVPTFNPEWELTREQSQTIREIGAYYPSPQRAYIKKMQKFFDDIEKAAANSPYVNPYEDDYLSEGKISEITDDIFRKWVCGYMQVLTSTAEADWLKSAVHIFEFRCYFKEKYGVAVWLNWENNDLKSFSFYKKDLLEMFNRSKYEPVTFEIS